MACVGLIPSFLETEILVLCFLSLSIWVLEQYRRPKDMAWEGGTCHLSCLDVQGQLWTL